MIELRPHLMQGSRRAGELLQALGVSRVTLMNAYQRESDGVLRFGRARRTRYAARKIHTGLDTDTLPVFRVDETGTLHRAGELVTLVASESVWLPGDTVINGIPPEMHDMSPKGFLGRSYARRHADLSLPEDVTNWSDHHVLIALSRRGEDLPGNLVVGRESFDRFQSLHPGANTLEDFRRLADKAIAGEHIGSSAGGDQPKFTAFVDGKHRIVKFATDVSDNARRWQDLLLLEHLALQTLKDAGIDAAHTEIVDQSGLRCLIVDRFDRIGKSGRRAVMTFAAAGENVDDSWTDSAEKLHRRGELNDIDLHQIALLDAYGALIANTDRHHYNLLLFPSGEGYSVAPAFDQLPMAYAPPASGNLRISAIDQPHAAVNTVDVWDQARELANAFWHCAAQQQLSEQMTAIVRTHASR